MSENTTQSEIQSDKEKLCELIAELRSFENCETGGPLHVVTDDGNLSVADIGFCLKYLTQHWSLTFYNSSAVIAVCCEIAGLMLCMSEGERLELYDKGWNPS
jgi:hypothetical protein